MSPQRRRRARLFLLAGRRETSVQRQREPANRRRCGFFALFSSRAVALPLRLLYHYRSRRAKPHDPAPPAHRKPSRARGIDPATLHRGSRHDRRRRERRAVAKNVSFYATTNASRVASSFASRSRREGVRCLSSRGGALLCLVVARHKSHHPSSPRLPYDSRVGRFRRRRPSR